MKRWFIIGAFVLFGALWLRPAPALAALHICNKTSLKTYVAVAVLSGDCVFLECNEHIWGWYNLEPGDCVEPVSADLDTSGDTDYYYYAEDTGGATWTGDTTLCVDPHYKFDYNDSDDESCTSGVHKKFKKIPTASYTDYTWSLLPS
jgi:uncharacterized membrane protein